MSEEIPSREEAPESKPLRPSPAVEASLRRYWRSNVKIMAVLLAVWAVAGLGCGVVFADKLAAVRLGGFPLGFWFAQQGSIVIFVVLILVYALLLNRLDARHHAEIESIRASEEGPVA